MPENGRAAMKSGTDADKESILWPAGLEWRSEGMAGNNCDMCVNYVYDEDYECYSCLVSLDEDEMYRFLSGSRWECPYFRTDDEYAVVRHQNG